MCSNLVFKTKRIICHKYHTANLVEPEKTKIYLLSILEHFPKYAGNYIFYNKDADSLLKNIKDYVKKMELQIKY